MFHYSFKADGVSANTVKQRELSLRPTSLVEAGKTTLLKTSMYSSKLEQLRRARQVLTNTIVPAIARKLHTILTTVKTIAKKKNRQIM